MGRKGGRKGGDSCIMPFHYVQQGTLSGGVSSFALCPSNFPRPQTEADTWAHFRVKSLAFRLHPTSSSGNDQAIGYVGGVQDTNPSTIVQVGELLPSAFMDHVCTVPTEWVRPSKAELAGPLPWYKALPGSADPTEESPGTMIVVGTATQSFVAEYRGVFEFKTSVATANTPMALKLRESVRNEKLLLTQLAEKDRLLKILQAGGTVTPAVKLFV